VIKLTDPIPNDLLAAREGFPEEIFEKFKASFDRLLERFEQKLGRALEGLRASGRYPDALKAWARTAAGVMRGPSDVHAGPEDRDALYEALLEAGAEDFQIHLDRGLRVGFLVRDLDGRTLLDRTPEALVRQHRDELRPLLESRVPAPPSADREG